MSLTKKQAQRIEKIALRYLGRKYRSRFRCQDFVCAVYREVGISVPTRRHNVTREQLKNPPLGYVIYLKHKREREKPSTHMGIIVSGKRCIHNSYYFGKWVVITPLEELFKV